MKLDTNAEKLITNNVPKAGDITLHNGEQFAINAASYYELLMTNADRNDRKKFYMTSGITIYSMSLQRWEPSMSINRSLTICMPGS